MKFHIVLTLCAVGLICIVNADNEPITTAKPVTTTTETITTTPKNKTTTPTTKPTTPTTKPTTPTTKPTTPTTKPTTPTTKPTTPKTKPSTTSTRPTIPTTKKPTGTPRFSVKDGNMTCLMLESEITVKFMYNSSVTMKDVEMKTMIGWDALTIGICGNDTDILNLYWNDTGFDMLLRLTFSKEKDDYSLTRVYMRYDYANTTYPVSGNFSDDVNNFTTGVGSSYNCSSGANLTLSGLTLKLEKLRINAFIHSEVPNPDFQDNGKSCPASGGGSKSKTDVIVPIAVGAALAAMVLIVLVGYCIGRRRQNAGYQSMDQ